MNSKCFTKYTGYTTIDYFEHFILEGDRKYNFFIQFIVDSRK